MPRQKRKRRTPQCLTDALECVVISPIEHERIARLHRARCTLREMLSERGYAHVDKVLPPVSRQAYQREFVKWYQSEKVLHVPSHPKPCGMVEHLFRDAPHHKLLVVRLITEKSIGVDSFRPIIEEAKTKHYYRIMVLVDKPLTPIAKKTLLSERRHNRFFEVFTLQELATNKSHHKAQPMFTLLDWKTRRAVIEQYAGGQARRLQRMYESDPMARHYGLLQGDVVKIESVSETSGQYIRYRFVLRRSAKHNFCDPMLSAK